MPHAPDLPAMLAVADAALLIGDPALFADTRAHGMPKIDKIDLGAEWTAMTGLPFVWAFWAGRPGAAGPEVVAILQEAARHGVARSDALADAFFAGDPIRQSVGRRYLREHLQYNFTARMLEGLRRYYAEALSLGLVGPRRSHRVLRVGSEAGCGGDMTGSDLRTLVDYNYWARDRILDAVAALTPEPVHARDGQQFCVSARHARAYLLG